jgi:hypothetical protein
MFSSDSLPGIPIWERGYISLLKFFNENNIYFINHKVTTISSSINVWKIGSQIDIDFKSSIGG